MVDCIFPTSKNKMTKIFPPYFGIFDAVLCIFSFAYDGISRFTLVLEMFEIDNHDGLLFYFLIAVCMFSVQKVDFFP